ncbi:putative alpha-L-fucosidase 1 [Dichanthelium oligosanthes]|uniref:Putative alpha-L-fucosidase 1 n=1 Tax=Dichanthelium oligosanthes TaxID=888268 RepID=A0A1E5UK59_9POAL|nr:putative alpha-L-fucosidase 1 [Dichanthelium oligosanthes]
MLIVRDGVPVHRFVAVPRREVQPQPDPLRARGGGELGDDVPGPASPRRGGHRVVGQRRRPEAEAVVVLGREHDAAEPAPRRDARPLARVERRGGEHGGVGAAGAPLGVREGVGPEVEEERHLRELPPELRVGRDRQDR